MCCACGVPQRVGQRLLHDPERGDRDLARHLVQMADDLSGDPRALLVL